jgi:hypothetical protein
LIASVLNLWAAMLVVRAVWFCKRLTRCEHGVVCKGILKKKLVISDELKVGFEATGTSVA